MFIKPLIAVIILFSLTSKASLYDFLSDQSEIKSILTDAPATYRSRFFSKLRKLIVEEVKKEIPSFSGLKFDELTNENQDFRKRLRMLSQVIFTFKVSLAFNYYAPHLRPGIAEYILDKSNVNDMFIEYDIPFDHGIHLFANVFYSNLMREKDSYYITNEEYDWFSELEYSLEDSANISWGKILYNPTFLFKDMMNNRHAKVNGPWLSPRFTTLLNDQFWSEFDLPLFFTKSNVNKYLFLNFDDGQMMKDLQRYMYNILNEEIEENEAFIWENFENLILEYISLSRVTLPPTNSEEIDQYGFKTIKVTPTDHPMALKAVIYTGVDNYTKYLVLLPQRFIQKKDPKFLRMMRKVCLDSKTLSQASNQASGQGILKLEATLTDAMHNQDALKWIKRNSTAIQRKDMNGCRASVINVKGSNYIIGNQIMMGLK
jgi:hypothetical protein